MTKEHFNPLNYREAVLPIGETRELLWQTANNALGNEIQHSEEYNHFMADVVGHLFETVDRVEADSTAFAGALPEGEVPGISLASLVAGTDEQKTEILEDAKSPFSNDETVNPFQIDDERLSALYALDLYMGAAYDAMKNDKH